MPMDRDIIKLKKDLGKNRMPQARGVGIDLEEVDRFRNHNVAVNSNFYKKIFTDREISYCLTKRDPYPSFAARFAAKEAVAKATGMTLFELRSIEIINEKTGRPTAMIRSHPGWSVEVSLSHTKKHGAAIAIWLH